MIDQPFKTKEAWIEYLSAVDMPVLRQTVRRLEEIHQHIDHVNGRDITEVVLQDPLLAIKVLAYLQRLEGKYLHSDITTIANAVMMIGIEPFFAHFQSLTTIEALLKDEPQAVLGVLHVIRRVQRASYYAQQWAFERYDMNIEEVGLAALLHDLAEILLWCFAPRLAVEIRKRQQADPTLRSATAQLQVLGIRLFDLQLALCDAWQLPELLKTLMDDVNAGLPRVRNVVLAVNLARHSASDWNNPALPDDFDAIEKLLRIDRQTLLARLRVPDEAAARYLALSDKGQKTEDKGQNGVQ
ncbi:MAG: HDOD domain-containing protein [Candidatus Accumulibacter sp.]|jgi:HD-like signal output (HDOD) protein|nr:HDOD domain-containing protein [Accumulibacter sp.]